MITKDFLRHRRRFELSDSDIQALEGAISEVRIIPPRQIVIRQGELISHSTLLLEGLMCRYMDDRQGERQLVALQVPGDFVDLHGFPLRRLDHDVATLTEAKVALVPHRALMQIVEERPTLTRLLWFSTLLDAAMHREWIFRLGRLDALARISHFFCEANVRLAAVGRSDGRRFALDIIQTDIADACGLTPVHVNRVLRKLREDRMMTFRQGQVELIDYDRLARIAEFEPSYLYLDSHDVP